MGAQRIRDVDERAMFRLLAANADLLAVVLGGLHTLLALALGSSRTCVGVAHRPAGTLAVLRLLAVACFGSAAVLAFVCRRSLPSRLAGVAGAVVLALADDRLLAAARAPCGDS